MTEADDVILERVRAALMAEHRVDLAHHPIGIHVAKGAVTLAGTLGDLGAKKVALQVARDVSGVLDVGDRLTVRPATRISDADLQDRVLGNLINDPSIGDYALFIVDQGRMIEKSRPQNLDGQIVIEIEDGIVTLRGEVANFRDKSQVGIDCWRSQGARDVVNALTIRQKAPRISVEELLAEAVRLSWATDPTLDAGRLKVRCEQTVAVLEGQVTCPRELERAEEDAWEVFGIAGIRNAIDVQDGPQNALF